MITTPFPPIAPTTFTKAQTAEILDALRAYRLGDGYLCCWMRDAYIRCKFDTRTLKEAYAWIDASIARCDSLEAWLFTRYGELHPHHHPHMQAYRLAWVKHLITYLESYHGQEASISPYFDPAAR